MQHIKLHHLYYLNIWLNKCTSYRDNIECTYEYICGKEMLVVQYLGKYQTTILGQDYINNNIFVIPFSYYKSCESFYKNTLKIIDRFIVPKDLY